MAQLFLRYKEDDLASMSAQITYYLILAFFPFLFFLINLLSFTPVSNRILFANFAALLPNDAAVLVKNMVVQAMQDKSETLLLLGMIGSLWAASQGMSAVIRGLNHSYDVKETRNFFKRYFSALISTVCVSVMITFSFLMIVFGRIIGTYAFELIGEKTLFQSIWPWLRYGISHLFLLVTFYLMYRYLPNKKLKFRNIMIGTVFATVGWVSASSLFSFYVNSFASYQRVYGSLGGIFALIIWLYISTLIILLGGELNAISSKFEEKEKI